MQTAIWVDCPGVTNDGRQLHMMRDSCYSCAPFWERIPVCPRCGNKLMKTGKTKCKKCQVYVFVDDEVRDPKVME